MPASFQKPALFMVLLVLAYFGNKTRSITCITPFLPEMSAVVTILSLIFTPLVKSILIFCPFNVATKVLVRSVDITFPATTW